MAKLETPIKQELLKLIRSYPFVQDAERVENSTSSGNPDINVYLKGSKDLIRIEVKRKGNKLSIMQKKKHDWYKYSFVIYCDSKGNLALYQQKIFRSRNEVLLYLLTQYKLIVRPNYTTTLQGDNNHD